jgi:hypothetical protein
VYKVLQHHIHLLKNNEHNLSRIYQDPELIQRIRIYEFKFPVAMAEGHHPYPFRTRQLSPPASMVLQGQPCGRVEHRRRTFNKRRQLVKTTGCLCFGRKRYRSKKREKNFKDLRKLYIEISFILFPVNPS